MKRLYMGAQHSSMMARVGNLTMLPVLGFMLIGIAHPSSGLDLSKEIARLPKDKRPTQAQVAAAQEDEATQKQHEQEVWRRIEPLLNEWATKGKPYLPRAIFPTDLPQAEIPAFPGAEGAGKYSFGGRGGKVFLVTSLEDSGAGTFREACEAAGPRFVLFNVAGIIRLKSPIHLVAPYITITGQTAPGDGVCIAGRTVHIDTHDVVIRYMRFRRGATNLFDRDDCLGGNPIGNVIIDHCSTSWGLDENLSLYRHMYRPKDAGEPLKLPTLNLTIQWCISAEALNTYGHAFGGTWGGCNTTFYHNLFACNTGRNASIGMSYDFNFLNNVLFNWRHRTLDGGDQGSRVNCINNYYKPGPVTMDTVRHRLGLPQASTFRPDSTLRYGKWYVAGNVVEGDSQVTADNWGGGVQFKDGTGSEAPDPVRDARQLKALVNRVRVTEPFPMAPVRLQTAQAAYEAVLVGVGATLPRRDAVDQRVIQEVRSGKVTREDLKGIVSDVSEVGGYPDYRGEPIPDLGPDGIPLAWKKKYNLDPNDRSLAGKDLAGDGCTVIEKYLAGLDPTKKLDAAEPNL